MKHLAVLLVGVFLLAAAGVQAEEAGNKGYIYLNNKICPISGGAVDEMGKPLEVDYKGTKINLCCKMCKKDFEKDPEMHIKKLKEMEGGESMDADGNMDGHAGH